MNLNQTDYILPYDEHAEKAVLGALLIETEAFHTVEQILNADMFYCDNHKILYRTIAQMYQNNIGVDLVTVSNELKNKKLFNDSLTPLFIAELSSRVGSAAHILQHALYIKQEYIKRSVIEVSQKAMQSIYSGDDIADVLYQLSQSVNVIEEGSTNVSTLKHIREYASQAIAESERRVTNFRNGVQNGITTGLEDLDKITGGWQNGELVIIASRPAMGKTALAIKFMESAASSYQDVAMFTLEMKGERLVDRIILAKTGIDSWKYKRGCLTNEEINLVEDTSTYLYKLPIYIDDNSSQTMSRIKAKCRVLKKKNKCKLVIIDYLQLTESEGKTNNREQEVAKISREAKKMAKSLNIPVLLLSQLSRNVEARANKRPQLSDLRESGAIEQDADMVCFIHRPEYYQQSLIYNNQEINNGIELIIAKYREGAVGSVYLQHDGTVRNISDYHIDNPF